MRKQLHRNRFIALLLGVAALLSAGFAAADPPVRVVRLGYTSGPVSFSPAGENDWVQATVNRPLITGDRLWTDAPARTELQVGRVAMRMGSTTSVTLLNLDDRVVQLQLAQGALDIRVRGFDDEPRAGDRHAEPRVFDPSRGRLSRRRRPRGQCHDGDDAQRPGRSLRRTRRVRGRRGRCLPLLRDRPRRLRIPGPAAARRARPLGVRARPPLGHLGVRALRFARGHRLSGPRCQRRLARRGRLRQRVGAQPPRHRLGAVSRRPLGVDRSVGLDLGRQRAVGVRGIPLWPLGEHPGLPGAGCRDP